jgi:hypothetical protein
MVDDSDTAQKYVQHAARSSTFYIVLQKQCVYVDDTMSVENAWVCYNIVTRANLPV